MRVKSARGRKPPKQLSSAELPQVLSEGEKRDRLRLIRTPNIGVVTFWELLAHFGSASAAIEGLPDFAKYGSGASARIPPEGVIEAELERAAAAGMTLHAAGEPGYPPLLAQIEAPPPLLYAKGDTDIWSRAPVAIVGSRNASGAGLKFAAEVAADLGRRGFLIVSGLARGVDGAAHRASLPFGTCAVLAGGLDVIYPPEHGGLAADITRNGVLIGECPPGFVARSQDFPRRNRIISGASLGVLVVEASERSGSLITARLAGEQGREVFAAPGHPLEPRAAGSNRLIKEGAILATCAGDVADVLHDLLKAWLSRAPMLAPLSEAEIGEPNIISDAQGNTSGASSHEKGSDDGYDFMDGAVKEIEQLLSLSPIDIDELCRLSGLDIKQVQAALMSLDLAGRIERCGVRLVSLKP
jgi:DNA processing protein